MATVYRGVGTRMARMVGQHSVMDEAAEKIRARAAANAASHRDTGAYSSNFTVERVTAKVGGVKDRMVVNDHPAALAIEFGHFTRARDGGVGSFVPGQLNLVRAVMG